MDSSSGGLMVAIAMALALCACKNGGNDAGLSCQSLHNVVSSANSRNTCSGNCTVSNTVAATDGHFGTSTTLSFDATGAGSVAIRAQASNGGMFAAGSVVGVIYSASASNQTSPMYQLNTYLAGTLQDTFTLSQDGVGSPARQTSHSGNTTTRPYDAVEFAFVRTSGTASATAQVYELCSD